MKHNFSLGQELIYEMTNLDESSSLCELNYCLDNNDDRLHCNEDNDSNEQSRFAQLPLAQWGPEECMEWGIYISHQYDLDNLYIDIGTLSRTDGPQLMQSTMRNFCWLLGDQYGAIFYKEIQKLKNNVPTVGPRRYPDSDMNKGAGQSQCVNTGGQSRYPDGNERTRAEQSQCVNTGCQSRYSDGNERTRAEQSHCIGDFDSYISSMDSFSDSYSCPKDLKSSHCFRNKVYYHIRDALKSLA